MQTPVATPLVRVTWHAMAAAYYWMSAANDDGIACVDEGLEIGRASGVHTWDMLLCAQGAFASLSSGRMDTAAGYLKHMDTLWSTSRPMDTAIYYYLSAWNSLMNGSLPRAYEQAQSALSLAENAGARFPAAIMRNDFARVFFYLGKPEEARIVVRQARAEGRLMRAQTIKYLTFLTEAEMAMERQDEETCLEQLRHCLVVGKEQGFQNHTWWRAEVMARLYAKALEHRIEVDYVQSLIRKRRLSPPEGSVPENWPFPLKLHTLGRFDVLVDDKPLSRARAHKKPLELLQALVTLGGHDVDEDNLAATLWPEAEGDGARLNLKINVHRLRQLLPKGAIAWSEGKLSLDARQWWVDLWALERELGRLDRSPQTDAPESNSCVKRILSLYQGEFLPQNTAPWALGARERLRHKTLRLVARAAESLGQHDPAATISIYEKAIELDPLYESLYQGLMRCHQRLRQPAEGLHVYRRCRDALQRELGVSPSPATETLRQSLKTGV